MKKISTILAGLAMVLGIGWFAPASAQVAYPVNFTCVAGGGCTNPFNDSGTNTVRLTNGIAWTNQFIALMTSKATPGGGFANICITYKATSGTAGVSILVTNLLPTVTYSAYPASSGYVTECRLVFLPNPTGATGPYTSLYMARAGGTGTGVNVRTIEIL